MQLIYFFITTIINYILKIYLYFRIFKKKEDPSRFKEKLAIYSIKNNYENLIWFHCASIGELKSVFPIIDYYLEKKKFNILVTTITLSSYKIFEKKYKKKRNIIHQFAPIDSPQIVKRFFSEWRPIFIFFTESEMWPNQILEAKKLGIPIILINARLSQKSFKKWLIVKNFASKILRSFNLILCQSKESLKHFKYFNTNNVEMIGNLKFIINDNEKIVDIENKNLINKKIFLALSTHRTEENVCIEAHKILKKYYPNLLTIIIPRHIHRIKEIEITVKKSQLNYLIANSFSSIKNNYDIIIVNSYGETQNYLRFSKFVFIGGSLIKHGGQNPLEVALNNSVILHGPYVNNFFEIYEFLNNLGSSFKINSTEDLINRLKEIFNSNKVIDTKIKIKEIGKEIYNNTITKLETYLSTK